MLLTMLRCLLCFSLLLCSGLSLAAEIITNYHSNIEVLSNSEMQVTESITVRAERNKIKRGIYRDFPLNYKDRLGNRYKVGFEILSVRRNGRNEPFHTKNTNKGIRIYIGNKDKLISTGTHRFDITYKTNRQLGFFDSHDELYWNVTGNEWAFPIQQASATVKLPSGINRNDIKLDAYTGRYGNSGKNFRAWLDDLGQANFQTTLTLNSQEGLTIVVGWPKGYVKEPDWKEKIFYVLKDNIGIYIGVIGLLLIIIYYSYFWSKVGKDPEKGVIIPHYEPPEGYSPASMRYIEEMGYDKTCFAAALVNLAVKGYLKINDVRSKFTLEKLQGSDQPLAAGEKTLLNKLFAFGDRIALENKNHTRISAALDAHEASLQRDYEKKYFQTNSGYFYFGLVLTIGICILALIKQVDISSTGPEVIFMLVWLSIWSVGLFGLVSNAWHSWRRVSSASSTVGAIGSTLFAIPFLFFEVMVLGMLAQQTSWTIPALVIIALLINWLFYELLKAPTLAGRDLLDKVEGFKLYIDIAERHDLEYKHVGGKTPELFERYLPYAIAFNIEHSWATQFEDVLRHAAETGHDYQPSWYHGTRWSSSNLTGFTSSVGSSLSSAIASSSTAPGSSSGGGGGGFSGGGGGGGGGGGW